MTTSNVCCLWLPKNGHILWPKRVGAVKNKYYATRLKWHFVYTGHLHLRCITLKKRKSLPLPGYDPRTF